MLRSVTENPSLFSTHIYVYFTQEETRSNGLKLSIILVWSLFISFVILRKEKYNNWSNNEKFHVWKNLSIDYGWERPFVFLPGLLCSFDLNKKTEHFCKVCKAC